MINIEQYFKDLKNSLSSDVNKASVLMNYEAFNKVFMSFNLNEKSVITY